MALFSGVKWGEPDRINPRIINRVQYHPTVAAPCLFQNQSSHIQIQKKNPFNEIESIKSVKSGRYKKWNKSIKLQCPLPLDPLKSLKIEQHKPPVCEKKKERNQERKREGEKTDPTTPIRANRTNESADGARLRPACQTTSEQMNQNAPGSFDKLGAAQRLEAN